MKDAWHLFKIRSAILTSPNLSLTFGDTSLRPPEIKKAAASILFVSAISLLDDATETRLPSGEAKGLEKRLEALCKRGDLLNYQTLDRLRCRRNEISHAQNKDATVKELEQACMAIQEQLVAWGLVEDGPLYTLEFERSAMRGSERDYIVRSHERRKDSRAGEAPKQTLDK